MSIAHTIENHPELENISPGIVLDLFWKHSVVGVSLVGPEGRWIHPSPRLCEWLGYTKEQLERMTWMDITIRTDRKEDIEAARSVMDGTTDEYSMFKTYIRRNSTLMPATLAVVPIKDTDQKVVMFLSQIERDDSGNAVPPLDELRVVANFAKSNRKQLVAGFMFYTIAVALAGDGALRWLRQVLESFTGFGLDG